jgi:hypothetical protein
MYMKEKDPRWSLGSSFDRGSAAAVGPKCTLLHTRFQGIAGRNESKSTVPVAERDSLPSRWDSPLASGAAGQERARNGVLDLEHPAETTLAAFHNCSAGITGDRGSVLIEY